MERREIVVHGRRFTPYLSPDRIAEAVRHLAGRITSGYAEREAPLALCMLNGAYVFAADLLRCLPFQLPVEFVRYASYQGESSTGRCRQLLGLNVSLSGRSVLIVEDIVDSGLTMRSLLDELSAQGASEVRIATMFFKPEAFCGDYAVDYVGLELPNRFVLGYGLDYDGLGRNLPGLYILSD